MSRMLRCASVLLLGGALAALAAKAATPSAALCASLKAKATGIRMAATLACHATAARRGGITSLTCLAAAERKFRRLFVKADTKGTCGMVEDAATIGDSITAFAEGMATGFLPEGAPSRSRGCASVKMLRVGAYGRGRLSCWARAFRSGNDMDPGCAHKVATGVEHGFAKAEANGSCVTAGDLPTVENAANGFIDAVAALLMPLPTTTTTPGSTSTTTTTAPPGGTTTTVVGASTTTTLVSGIVNLSSNVQPIFSANCAVPGCHVGANAPKGLDLSSGHAYGNLVNVASAECPLFKRVLPTRPDQSYLVFKVTGPPQPCFSGNQMPSGGAAPLSTADQNLIKAWITQGALDN